VPGDPAGYRSPSTPAPNRPTTRGQTADLPVPGTNAAFGYAFRVDLTMQNTNTAITVAGHPLPIRLARPRACASQTETHLPRTHDRYSAMTCAQSSAVSAETTVAHAHSTTPAAAG
jgi:hypothetical protein